MEFVVFVWLCAGITVLLSAAACALFGGRFRSELGYGLGLAALMAALCFYLPACENLWNNMARLMGLPHRSELFRGVWQLAHLFRNLWPALGAAVLGMAFGVAAYPQSGAYRAMKRFHHTKIVLMCLLLGLAGLLWFFRSAQTLQIALLNAALYTACWYWRFGFDTITFTLKKNGVPLFAAVCLLTASCIMAGSAFILPVVLIMGIGISDIWMDYHRRGSAKLLFTLQLK